MSDYDYFLEPPSHAERWRGFEPTEKDSYKALVDCAGMALEAEENESYTKRCIAGEKVFYYDWPHALVPGHIYSDLGMEEFKISQCCEYHFDEYFKEDE